ncbi:hypothetical protein JXB41_02615 [Candidatus Woesearchaeota archaeon]|nr:hypothetical protein [Candidatus Woesearchaeota archaeon]
MPVDWFKRAVIYQILIDRFAGYDKEKAKDWDKPVFTGGNIKGIIEKLPYLKELGINTLWISPFYRTSAYHGYHITDFFKVEPEFGTEEDLKSLIKKTHGSGMRIIADFVPNHCSDKHPFFLEAKKDKNSQYYKWFYFKKWPQNYLCFLSVKELPKLNLSCLEARDHIVESAKHWLSLGLDGFRLDHVIGPKHKFWKFFRKEIKQEFPDAVLIGEAWMRGIKFKELKTINIKNKYFKWLLGASSDNLFREYIDELDGVLDFKFQELMSKYIAGQDIPDKGLLLRKLKRHYSKYPDNFFLPSFLDNHDMDRFLFQCGNNNEKFKLAAEIQFSAEQPKIIYYGNETAMSQEKSAWDFQAYGDLQARQPMKWRNYDNESLDFYKMLIKNSKSD